MLMYTIEGPYLLPSRHLFTSQTTQSSISVSGDRRMIEKYGSKYSLAPMSCNPTSSNIIRSEWVVDAFVVMGPTKRMRLGTSEVGSSRKVGCLM